MDHQSNLSYPRQSAEDGTNSNPIPIPNLHLNGLNIDTTGLPFNTWFNSYPYRSPPVSSPSESTFSGNASSFPSSPTFSANQAYFAGPPMGYQTPSLCVGSLDSPHSMDTFPIQTSQVIDGQFDLACFGTLDELFLPQTLSPRLGNSSLDPASYTGLSINDYLSSGESRVAQASRSMSFSPVDSEDPTPRGNIVSHRRSGSTASSSGYSVSGTHSDYLNTSEISSLHHGIAKASTFGSNSAPEPSSASSLTPAELVQCFQHSSEVMEDRLEPTDHRRRSIFLQLLCETPKLPHHYQCVVPRSNGALCGKTFNRSDRGLTHIRTHFKHRPFWCNGQCGDKKCSHKFHSNEGRAAHLHPKFEYCTKCHNRFRRQSVRRHEERCPGPQ